MDFDADADFAPDRFSRMQGNAALEALGYNTMTNGLNIKAVIDLLGNVISPNNKKKTYAAPSLKQEEIILQLQEKYTASFYSETFGISLERVDAFIYFAEENAVTPKLLKPENEIRLLEVLFEQSVLYKKRISDE